MILVWSLSCWYIQASLSSVDILELEKWRDQIPGKSFRCHFRSLFKFSSFFIFLSDFLFLSIIFFVHFPSIVFSSIFSLFHSFTFSFKFSFFLQSRFLMLFFLFFFASNLISKQLFSFHPSSLFVFPLLPYLSLHLILYSLFVFLFFDIYFFLLVSSIPEMAAYSIFGWNCRVLSMSFGPGSWHGLFVKKMNSW